MTMVDSIREKHSHLKSIVSAHSPNPEAVQIMAVTKYATPAQTQAMIQAGLTLLGENKVQNGMEKQLAVDPNHACIWHFIGHLQSNKVKKAVANFDLIQSVDSLSILEKIGQEAQAIGKKMPVLLEINSGEEPQKYGFFISEIETHHEQFFACPGVEIKGVMTMGPLGKSPEESRPFFLRTKKLYEGLKSVYSGVNILSMGMSSDYPIALEEGSTLIRLGSFFIQ